MKNLFNSLKTIGLMILSVIFFIMGITAFAKSMFVNLLLIIVAIFILFVASDNFDKTNGLGIYSKNLNDTNQS